MPGSVAPAFAVSPPKLGLSGGRGADHHRGHHHAPGRQRVQRVPGGPGRTAPAIGACLGGRARLSAWAASAGAPGRAASARPARSANAQLAVDWPSPSKRVTAGCCARAAGEDGRRGRYRGGHAGARAVHPGGRGGRAPGRQAAPRRRRARLIGRGARAGARCTAAAQTAPPGAGGGAGAAAAAQRSSRARHGPQGAARPARARAWCAGCWACGRPGCVAVLSLMHSVGALIVRSVGWSVRGSKRAPCILQMRRGTV